MAAQYQIKHAGAGSYSIGSVTLPGKSTTMVDTAVWEEILEAHKESAGLQNRLNGKVITYKKIENEKAAAAAQVETAAQSLAAMTVADAVAAVEACGDVTLLGEYQAAEMARLNAKGKPASRQQVLGAIEERLAQLAAGASSPVE
jgi:hypothetical protein